MIREMRTVNKFNRELKKLQNKGSQFKVSPGRFNTERQLTTLNGKAWLNVYLNSNKKALELSKGGTNNNVRGKGYGLLLRAVPILAASKVKNIKTIEHTSSFVNNAQRKKYSVPPSRRIVQYLGLVPVSNEDERLILKNLNKMTRARVENVVFGRGFNKNLYNRIAGPRKALSYGPRTKKVQRKPRWYNTFLRFVKL
jgi:hypothetical protein